MVAARHGRLLPAETWVASEASLHPSTAPDVIEAIHRREVAAYLRRHPEATAEEVSVALTLPVWNVARAVKALELNKGAA